MYAKKINGAIRRSSLTAAAAITVRQYTLCILPDLHRQVSAIIYGKNTLDVASVKPSSGHSIDENLKESC